MKPPAIDGATEPTAEAIRLCRQYAMQKFEEAQASDVYVCGMQPFDADDLMYGVIVAREGLECHHHMEFEYYNNPKILTSRFTATLLGAYCAGSSREEGFVDEHLCIERKSMLLVCQPCRTKGALPIARSKRRNGA